MIRPMGSRILTRRVEVEDVDSVIIIPDQYKERPELALVVGMGPKCDLDKLQFCIDDIVFIGSYSGTEVEHEDVVYLLITEDMVMARTDFTRADLDEDMKLKGV